MKPCICAVTRSYYGYMGYHVIVQASLESRPFEKMDCFAHVNLRTTQQTTYFYCHACMHVYTVIDILW